MAPSRSLRLKPPYLWLLESGRLQAVLRTPQFVSTTERLAAVTFDDGPNAKWTPTILECLARWDARGTFFVLGKQVAAHPGLTRRILSEGHELGNHTFSHPTLARCSPVRVARELRSCQAAIGDATGTSPRLMRAPFGAQAIDTFLTARLLGFTPVVWSASAADWQGESADVLLSRVMQDFRPGCIVLMHDSLEGPPDGSAASAAAVDRTPTIEALDGLLRAGTREGFRFVTVSELMRSGTVERAPWFYGWTWT